MNTLNDIKKSSLLRFLDSDSTDIFAKADGFFEYAEGLRREKLYCYRCCTLERDGCKTLVDLQGEKKWLIDCASNDYLGMNARPEVLEAVTV